MDDEDVIAPLAQENDDGASRVDPKQAGDSDASNGNNDPEPFDLESFSTLVERDLIAYSVSWDPLLQALRAIGASLAGQHRAREAMAGDVRALKEQLARSEGDKQAMTAALDQLQGDLGGMQAQLEKLQSEREQEAEAKAAEAAAKQSNEESDADENAAEHDASSSSTPSPTTPFVTPEELTEAQRSLARELKRSLSRAFGQEDGVHEHDGEEPIGSFRLPGAPFATKVEVDSAVAAVKEQLDRGLSAHDARLDALQDSIGNLDELSSQLSARVHEQLSSRLPATPPPPTSPTASTRGEIGAGESTPANDSILLKSIKELRSTQDAHERQLKQQQSLADKHAADLASLLAQLDDLSIQQQTVLSGMSMGPGSGTILSSRSDKSGHNLAGESTSGEGGHEPDGGGSASTQHQPMQLDLSLVFAKIADLRRTTDASLNSLQNNLANVSGASAGLQAQVDALRNGAVFSEHLQLHMIEAQLAMQKELLARNQRFQERTKPQLADWRRALDDNEAKLVRGQADDEILQELQQLQRNYRRTLMAITPLVNSPLSIAESAQTLSDEVRQLDHGRQVGVLPVRVPMGGDSDDEAENERAKRAAREREEEYARKLRFLDEEIAATLQVNVVTEKKNDPLLKSLDSMREKLEELWSMWHKNYNQKLRGGGSSSSNGEEASDAARLAGGSSGDAFGGSAEALRDVELRLMGAVRRLGALEEDVERLHTATDLNTSELATGATNAATRRVSNAAHGLEDLDVLKRELQAEIAKVAAMVDAHNSHPGSRRGLAQHNQHGNGGDLLTGLYAQLTGREIDGRFNDLAPDAQKQLHDAFMKELTKKVTNSVLASDKFAALSRSGGGAAGAAGGPGANAGGGANASANFRMLLDNFALKVEDRLDDARDTTAEELSRLRKELLDQIRLRLEAALRDLRAELQAYGLLPTPGADANGDSTAVGTKPVMCVACSRPVPVSGVVREAGAPAEVVIPEPSTLGPDYVSASFLSRTPWRLLTDDGWQEFERMEDDFVYRAGFKMPANDRCVVLPALVRCGNGLRDSLV